MTRPSAGAIAAAVAGLMVVAAGLWAQLTVVRGGPDSQSPDILLAGIYHAGEGQASHLFVRSLLTGEERVLDGDAAFIAAPTWAPDGSRLAWIEVAPEPGKAAIIVWDRRTGTRTLTTVSLQAIRGLEWSPDSALLAVIGHPFYVLNADGSIGAVGPLDASDPFRIRAPLNGWSHDSRRYAFIAGENVVLFDRVAGVIAALLPSAVGLADLANGYAAGGWNEDGTLTLFAAETMAFDVDFSATMSAPSTHVVEDFQPAPWRVEAYGDMVSRVPGIVVTQLYGESADGRGRVAVVWQPLNQARVFVDDGETLHHFEYLTTDASLRNLSVVLVGDWAAR